MKGLLLFFTHYTSFFSASFSIYPYLMIYFGIYEKADSLWCRKLISNRKVSTKHYVYEYSIVSTMIVT